MNQLCKAKQPALRDIRIDWKNPDQDVESDDGTPTFPLQAPENIKTFFNSSRLVAYSFTPNCLQVSVTMAVGDFSHFTVANVVYISLLTICSRRGVVVIVWSFETKGPEIAIL